MNDSVAVFYLIFSIFKSFLAEKFFLLLLLQWQTLLLKMCSNKTEQSKLTENFQYAFCLSFSQHRGLNMSNYDLLCCWKILADSWESCLQVMLLCMRVCISIADEDSDVILAIYPSWNFLFILPFLLLEAALKLLLFAATKLAVVMTISQQFLCMKTNTFISMWFIVFWHFDFFVNTLMPLLCGITKSEREASVPQGRLMTWLMSLGTKLINKTVLATKCLDIVLRNAHILDFIGKFNNISLITRILMA